MRKLAERLLKYLLKTIQGQGSKKSAERYFIPSEHEFAHKLCFMLHDLLTDVVVQGEKDEIFKIRLLLENEEVRKDLESRQGEDFFRWVEAHFPEQAEELLTKLICQGLLSDMCHFLYEALKNSEKHKLTVSFALLRKPFVENLCYLEMLLGDRKDFMMRFRQGTAEDLDLLRNEALKRPEARTAIISKAIRTANSAWSDAEIIHAIRYDKNSLNSFQTFWHHANHLITTQKQYKTLQTNFNFIFSDREATEEQWAFMYTFLPILLIHTYDVVEALVATFAKRKDHAVDVTDIRVRVGYFLWLKDSEFWDAAQEAGFTDAFNLLQLTCFHCGLPYSMDDENLRSFYEEAKLRCQNCGKIFDYTSLLTRAAQHSQ